MKRDAPNSNSKILFQLFAGFLQRDEVLPLRQSCGENNEASLVWEFQLARGQEELPFLFGT